MSNYLSAGIMESEVRIRSVRIAQIIWTQKNKTMLARRRWALELIRSKCATDKQ